MGEKLQCQRQEVNEQNHYAVVIVKRTVECTENQGIVHCTKFFVNPRELLCHGSHLWRLALASHCSPQLGKQCFAKYGFMAGYVDS